MQIKQDTIGDILDSEKEMFLRGAECYGEYFVHAADFNDLLNNFIKSIDDPTKFIFIAFLSQIKKHHTLALFSAVRLHHVQTGMNLRQVFESGAWAAYAMAHKEQEYFLEKKENQVIEVTKKLKLARDQWLDNNFKPKSDEIKNLKELINRSVAHANIVYAMQNFKAVTDSQKFLTPFFDFQDDYKVKSDLWLVANTALGLMDLFYGVNLQFKVFRFVDDFDVRFKGLVDQNTKLKTEMMNSERFKKSQEIVSPKAI